MFVGRPPGNYDRLLATAAPSRATFSSCRRASLLESLAEREPQDAGTTAAVAPRPDIPSIAEPHDDGSLNIGSLKGTSQYE